jgi:hypothetical protein
MSYMPNPLFVSICRTRQTKKSFCTHAILRLDNSGIYVYDVLKNGFADR